jgi:hypothetical protein
MQLLQIYLVIWRLRPARCCFRAGPFYRDDVERINAVPQQPQQHVHPVIRRARLIGQRLPQGG